MASASGAARGTAGRHFLPSLSQAVEQCARLAMLGVALLLCLVLALGLWLLAWSLVLSLADLLLADGARSALAPERARRTVLLLPPLVATAATLLAAGRWRLQSHRPTARLFDTAPAERRLHRPDLGRGWTLALVGACLLGFLAYARLVFLYHELHDANDEGFYLYAGRLILAGRMPFRDFYFDQAPLFPYLIAALLGPFNFDVVAARFVAIVATLLALAATFLAGLRLGGRLAGVIALGLLVTNLDFTTNAAEGIHSNGAFAALLVALTTLALASDRPGLALVAATLAAGVRLPLGLLPLVVASYLALARGRPVAAALLCALPLGLIFGPFFVLGGESTVLGLMKPLRTEMMLQWRGLDTSLDARVGYARDLAVAVASAYPAFLVAAVAGVIALWWRRASPWALHATLAVGVLAICIVNLWIYPGSLRYVTPALPMLAVFSASGVVALARPLLADATNRPAAQALYAVLAGLIVLSPLFASRGPDFIDQNKRKSSTALLQEVAARVLEYGGPDAVLLTLEPAVASQSGLQVVHGLEGGVWGLVRDPVVAEQFGLLSYDRLVQLVASGAGDVLVESDRWGVAGSALRVDEPARRRMRQAIQQAYVLRATIEDMPDWGDVRIYTRRS